MHELSGAGVTRRVVVDLDPLVAFAIRQCGQLGAIVPRIRCMKLVFGVVVLHLSSAHAMQAA